MACIGIFMGFVGIFGGRNGGDGQVFSSGLEAVSKQSRGLDVWHQEVVVFNKSLRQNLALARPRASPEELREAQGLRNLRTRGVSGLETMPMWPLTSIKSTKNHVKSNDIEWSPYENRRWRPRP